MEGHGTATKPQFGSMTVDDLQRFRDQELSAKLKSAGVADQTRSWIVSYVDALLEEINEST